MAPALAFSSMATLHLERAGLQHARHSGTLLSNHRIVLYRSICQP